MKFDPNAPYDRHFYDELEAIYPGIAADLSRIADLPDTVGQKVITVILYRACEAQNMRNITLGRKAAMELPRSWLLARMETVAGETLNLADEWEYRRFVELCLLLDDALARRQIVRGLASTDPQICEAANDYAGKNGGLSK